MSHLFSAAAAARETGVSRTTIMRKLDAGEFPQASKDDDGWHIPLEDLLAVGLTPGRPSPPDHPVRGHDQDTRDRAAELENQVEVLKAQLAGLKALVDAKDQTIDTQAHALRALEARSTTEPAQSPAPTPAQPAPPPSAPRRGGLLGLLRL